MINVTPLKFAAGLIVTAAISTFPAPNFNGGTPMDNTGALVVATTGGVVYSGGLNYTAAGAVVMINGGVIAGYVPGGFPVDVADKLVVVFGGTPAFWNAGIPFDASGRVCVVAPV